MAGGDSAGGAAVSKDDLRRMAAQKFAQLAQDMERTIELHPLEVYFSAARAGVVLTAHFAKHAVPDDMKSDFIDPAELRDDFFAALRSEWDQHMLSDNTPTRNG